MSFLLIFIYLKKKFLWNNEITQFLAVSQVIDTLFSLTIVLNPEENSEGLCIFQGFFQNFFNLLIIEWNFVVIIQLYFKLYSDSRVLKFLCGQRFLKKRALIFCIVISAAVSLIPLPYDGYQPGIIFCTISTENYYLPFICFYIPYWVFCVTTFYFLKQIEKISRERMNDPTNIINFLNQYRPFPISIVICFFPVSVFRTIEILFPEILIDPLIVTAFVLGLSHGFINGVIILWTFRKSLISARVNESFKSSALTQNEVGLEYRIVNRPLIS